MPKGKKKKEVKTTGAGQLHGSSRSPLRLLDRSGLNENEEGVIAFNLFV